jgi:hypothetical protein
MAITSLAETRYRRSLSANSIQQPREHLAFGLTDD